MSSPRQRLFSEIDIKVGLAIRKLRKSKSLSQADLARCLNVTFQQIQLYERGEGRIAVSALAKIAEGLGVDIVELLPQPPPLKRLAGIIEQDLMEDGDELLRAFYKVKSPRLRKAIIENLHSILDGESP